VASMPFKTNLRLIPMTFHSVGVACEEAEKLRRFDLGLDGKLSRACQHPDNLWSLPGIGFTMASCSAYITMKGMTVPAVSAGSTQAGAREVRPPEVSSPRSRSRKRLSRPARPTSSRFHDD